MNANASAASLMIDVASRAEAFERQRDAALAGLDRRHVEAGLIARPYAVTDRDEIEAVTDAPAELPRLILDLRLEFAPLTLYIGVGVGSLAVERARDALDDLKARAGKYARLTAFRTGDADRDAAIELIYRLHDTLIAQVSERQWETMAAARDADSQEALARRFDVEPSTITRNLRRGHYWQLKDTARMLSRQFASGPLAIETGAA